LSSEKKIDLDYVPEDVLEEILEEERRITKKKKSPYPSSRDIVEAVIEAARMARGIHPDEFPELVIKILEDRGFDTRHVTVKRIWGTYESLVRRGVIRDTLGVIGG